MQDGILFIQRDEEPVYFVKRSVERAAEEIRYCKVMKTAGVPACCF